MSRKTLWVCDRCGYGKVNETRPPEGWTCILKSQKNNIYAPTFVAELCKSCTSLFNDFIGNEIEENNGT